MKVEINEKVTQGGGLEQRSWNMRTERFKKEKKAQSLNREKGGIRR